MTPCDECLSKLCVTRDPYSGAITGIFYQTDAGLVPVPECGSGSGGSGGSGGGGSGSGSGSGGSGSGSGGGGSGGGGGGGGSGGGGGGCSFCEYVWNGQSWALGPVICEPGCTCPPPPNRPGDYFGEIVTYQCVPD